MEHPIGMDDLRGTPMTSETSIVVIKLTLHGGSQLFSLDVSGHSVKNMVGVTCNVGPPR